ncbi:CBD9-like protein [Tilletiaria anomala UBC 951]|uniref:CBD9-like protein n=1 Tax=Tilletiaria anomala (strain ATCC 24038 / CBS 436.72 / UBC 951) TaxID=1037660 RepID=A0A066WN81_TILAU|nr:CBD9-like protein [Tilletiaria anomala UBC 951]KDN52439.1 CBD9-like protein [Tilletiaria anomala UBC 951]
MRLLRSAAALAVAAGVAHASVFADSFTQSQYGFTLQAIYDSDAGHTNFTLHTLNSGQAVGWMGIGTGEQMAGSNMMVGWVNTDNTVVISQRTTAGEIMPTTKNIKAQRFTVDKTLSKTQSSGTTFAWSQPGFPEAGGNMQMVNMIWAVNPSDAPATADTSATIYKHASRGFITLDLTKPYTGGAITASDASSGAPKASRTMSMRNSIIIAHMVLSIVAWLILMPAGIFIARFGRTAFTWLPKHRIVQTVSIAFILIAMGLGFAIVKSEGGVDFSQRHHKLGFVLAMLAVFQGLLGQFGHMLWNAKRIRVQNYLHIIIGIVLFGLAPWNMALGFDLWVPWYPSVAGKYVCIAWAALLGVVYICGLALLPREFKTDRKAQELRAAIRIDSNDDVGGQHDRKA